ncbi:hypothetical protein MUK42_19866 [Musa troglodytarum]|uniref:Uncharacterized protein n=1 Tax=Musa troglodytarum TaxID=320322 RepID=A0A9E7FBA9_9LILI|nr:hypothetical protein MUK42_19866 [Musa troglodytarum]
MCSCRKDATDTTLVRSSHSHLNPDVKSVTGLMEDEEMELGKAVSIISNLKLWIIEVSTFNVTARWTSTTNV